MKEVTQGDSVSHEGNTREVLTVRHWNDTLVLGPRSDPDIVDVKDVN